MSSTIGPLQRAQLGRAGASSTQSSGARPSRLQEFKRGAARMRDDLVWAVLFEAYDWMITRRVVRDYGATSAFSEAQRQRAADTLDDLLDSSGMAVFTERLRTLANGERGKAFIADLRRSFAAATPERPARVWDIALRHSGGDRDDAIELIAVILQDVTGPVIDGEGGGFLNALPAGPVRDDLLATLRAMAAGLRAGTVEPYEWPGTGGASSYYHYYVPAYLSRRMVQEGVPPNLAFLTVGTFNLEYELAHYGVPLERARIILDRSLEVLDSTLGIGRERLDAKVAELRASQQVTNEFIYADVDLVLDLQLTEAQRRRYFAALVAELDLPPETIDELEALEPMTLHRIAPLVNVASMKVEREKRSLVALARSLIPAMRGYYQHGMRDAKDLPNETIGQIVLGFRGAAEVLEGRRMPVSPREIEQGVETNATQFMRDLFERMGPQDYPGLSWDSGHDTFERTLRAVGRQAASGTVAVVDVGFDRDQGLRLWTSSDGRHGHDFIDDDEDPFEGGLRIQHGTPVTQIAQGTSPRIRAMALRADITGVIAAIDYAASRGARVVNISQELVGESARDIQLFREALRRNPQVLVVLAAGNDGQRLGYRAHDVAMVEAPNLIKVASATREGFRWEGSNYHEQHVQLAARGESNRWRHARWGWLDSLERAARRTEWLGGEFTSHAAPVVSRVATQVGLVAPWMGAAQVRELLEATADKPAQWHDVVRSGLINADRALAVAAVLDLKRRGTAVEAALDQLGLTGDERGRVAAVVERMGH